ncbi:hypothetical protein [Streptomyces violarus]|uniref:hypothetical protein n=1 Tax=Streptomyces violarus TaxID=67380 RepID=UPI0021C05917|nr:hypothetical protein [Streptomyces violarus]MCT9142431.1 hypothetical protein [Streptomyces violarus]
MRKRSGRPPRFAAVPNETVDDADRLDLEALGLLTVVIRHQDGYEITLHEIAEKYGYGRDGLAGAWGLLQVARYIVKVQIQWASDNQWSTEVVVYDTPATDDEVQELLASIAQEQGVRTVKLMPPTKAARERAAKHAAKVAAKRKVKPGRRKLDYSVPSRAGAGESKGAGRRGDGQGQPDAAAPAAPAKKTPKPTGPKKTKEPGKRLSQHEAAAVKKVEAGFPEQLRALLPSYRPPVLRDAILEALESRKPDVLVDRVQRRWWKHGYEAAVAPGGKGIGSAVGVAVALVRPSTDCPVPLCEDGVILDDVDGSVGPCRTCERRQADRAGQVPAQRGGTGEHGDDQEHVGQPPARRWKCRTCHTPGKQGTEAPEDNLCGPCRKDAQDAAAAMAKLQEQLTSRETHREQLARDHFDELVEEAYAENAERERAAAEDLVRQRAEEERKAREAEERRLLHEKIAEENPYLLPYSQMA